MATNSIQLHEPTEQEQRDALDEFTRHMNAVDARRNSVDRAELQSALDAITDALTHHWSTGGGTRLRRFMWSLWNGWHLINLFDLCSGLDYQLGDAVLIVFRAQMVGALTEDQKRRVLAQSGEFARWEQMRADTPEDEEVLYPPPPLSTEELRRLANSATRSDQRPKQARPAGE